MKILTGIVVVSGMGKKSFQQYYYYIYYFYCNTKKNLTVIGGLSKMELISNQKKLIYVTLKVNS